MTTKEKLEERNFIMECIELYETLPAIWNTKSKEYSNRDKKNQQYEVLLSKYKERYVNADKQELIKKFNSLRTNFRKELKRISNSEKSGMGTEDVVEPTLWYFDQMKFLTNTEEPCSSQSSMMDEPELHESSVAEQEQPKDKPQKKRPKKDDSDQLISLACKRLAQPKNEFHSIATTWANDLEKMEATQQLFAKKAINEILFEGQMGTLHRNSVQINQDFISSTPNGHYADSDIICYDSNQEEIFGNEYKQ